MRNTHVCVCVCWGRFGLLPSNLAVICRRPRSMFGLSTFVYIFAFRFSFFSFFGVLLGFGWVWGFNVTAQGKSRGQKNSQPKVDCATIAIGKFIYVSAKCISCSVPMCVRVYLLLLQAVYLLIFYKCIFSF